MTRELLARAWAAGAGPGEEPLTIDLDSTLCESYGLAKEGAQRPGYSGARGYHPLLAVAAGSGEVLMARLREGRAHTARGAAHFLRETVARVREAGASGQLTLRADSGFYTHAVVAACRALDVRFSVTIRRQPNVRTLIEAIPQEDWTPIPYWIEGGADVAETTYTPFRHKEDASAVRLIVRRVRPTPGSQLALFSSYSYHAFISDREGELLELEADHRRHAEIENAIRDLKYGVGLNHLPSGRFTANAAWLAVQVIRAQPRPLDGAARARRGNRDDQDAQAALLRAGRAAHPLGPALDPAPAQALALVQSARSRARALAGAPAPGLTPVTAPGPRPGLAPACLRAPRAASRARPQRPRAALSEGSSLRSARAAAWRTPARPPNSPPARLPAPSSLDRWIRANAVRQTVPLTRSFAKVSSGRGRG